ncbi:hypothetical protein NSA47_10350 [Irregularibacter muris]|uniref:Uncharacterized protein n=1 Tax=Irregularibacter muris TaxID=1796619 RepID=A0AAE3L2V8_9FIRM|nr:hypothetical protein [Irregularibacter muris]MCR1899384.1 hypothetical protein [Irregularibacter muris]
MTIISERILESIQGYVKQGKSLGTVVFWILTFYKEVKGLKGNYKNLPQCLIDNAKFCVWKYEKSKIDKKPRKVPYQVNGKKTMANKINTFTSFNDAVNAVDKFDGLGIGVFNNISAIDIDDCIDENGNFSKLAKEVMGIF